MANPPRTFEPDTPVRRNPDAAWRAFESETAVLGPAASRVHTLNEVGARAWALADGRTFAEMMDVLLNEFEVERTELEADLRAFLHDLDERGLLAG